MASISLTLTDAQVTRIQAALAVNGVPATAAEVKSHLLQYLKGVCMIAEQRAAHNTADANVQTTLKNEGW